MMQLRTAGAGIDFVKRCLWSIEARLTLGSMSV
jgi:hypothetical protein